MAAMTTESRDPATPARQVESNPVWRVAVAALALIVLSPMGAAVDIPGWYATARQALSTQPQDLAAAASALDRAVARLPYDGLTQFRGGQIALAGGDADEAVARFKTAFTLIDVGATEHLALGDALLAQGRRADAVTEFETARDLAPGQPEPLARLAAAYEADARWDDAAGALAQLSQAGVATPDQIYRLAVLTAATDPATAGARLAVASEVPSVHQAQARHLLDAVTAATGQNDQAFAFATVGIALVQLEEWPLAEVALQKAVDANNGFADAFAYLGLAQDRQGKDGEPALAQAAALSPESPLVSFLYGLHFRGLSESAKAIPWLHKAQAADPANPAIAAELGGAYAATGDLTNGEEWFRKAVSLNDRDGQFWLLLARFYVDREYKVAEEGLPAARMAVGLNPNNALAADALGYALILTGDGLTGQQELERALSIDPTLAAAHYHLGVYYIGLGQVEKAEPYINQVLALDPTGPYGDLALKAKALISPTP